MKKRYVVLGDTDWNLIRKKKFDNAFWHRRKKDDDEIRQSVVAEEYRRDALWREQTNHQIGTIINKIESRQDMTLLDIGAGPAGQPVILSRSVKDVTIVETAPAIL